MNKIMEQRLVSGNRGIRADELYELWVMGLVDDDAVGCLHRREVCLVCLGEVCHVVLIGLYDNLQIISMVAVGVRDGIDYSFYAFNVLEENVVLLAAKQVFPMTQRRDVAFMTEIHGLVELPLALQQTRQKLEGSLRINRARSYRLKYKTSVIGQITEGEIFSNLILAECQMFLLRLGGAFRDQTGFLYFDNRNDGRDAFDAIFVFLLDGVLIFRRRF